MSYKTYTYKIYDISGTSSVSDINTIKVKNYPEFDMEINNGYGELTLDLDEKFDDFGTQYDNANLVKIYQHDDINKNGRLLYQGHIEEMRPYKRGRLEGLEVDLRSITGLLDLNVFMQGLTATGGVTFEGKDISEMLIEIIDDFRNGNSTSYGGLISYGESTIEGIGVSLNHNFEVKTYKEAIEEVRSITGSGGIIGS
jgi:hypothetical protein